MYTLSNNGGVTLDSTGMYIPQSQTQDWLNYQVWVAAGNTPSPAPVTPASSPTCALWQLQALVTPAQWAAVQAAVAASGNQVLIAFASHGTNQIPANSTVLASLAVAAGIDPSTLPALVTQASQISIP